MRNYLSTNPSVKSWLKYVVVAGLFFIFSILGAQKHEGKFQNIPIDVDDYDYWITAITQDDKGYMWISGQNGLYKYNGYEYEQFTNNPNDSTSLLSTNIEGLFINSIGKLWVATAIGPTQYQPDCNCFKSYRHDSNNRLISGAREFAEDSEDNLWMLTFSGGLLKYDPDNDHFIQIYKVTEEDRPMKFLIDQKDRIWMPSLTGLVRFDIHTEEVKIFKHEPNNINSLISNRISALLEDNKGQIWIGTSKSGLHLYNSENEDFIRMLPDGNDTNGIYAPQGKTEVWGTDPWVSILHQDRKGGYWIGTVGEGINYFEPETHKKTFYTSDPSDKDGISNNMYWSFHEDRQGQIWLGNLQGGLYKLNPFTPKFTLYADIKNAQRSFESPYTNGIIWAGSNGYGLHKLNEKTGETIEYMPDDNDPNSISHNWVRSIYQSDPQTLWIGLGVGAGDGVNKKNGGLDRMDLNTNTIKHYSIRRDEDPDDFSYTVLKILEDSLGRLWLGTGIGGMYRSNSAKTEFTHIPLPKNDSTVRDPILAFMPQIDNNGTLWVGDGLNKILYKYNIEKDNFSPYLYGFQISSILLDEKGWYWMGTWLQGLLHYNPEDGTYKHYTRKDGLPNNKGIYLLDDKKGTIWIGTRSGPAKIDTKTGIITPINLLTKEYQFGGTLSSTGKLYFNHPNGLLSFHPDDIKGNPHPPEVIISGFLVSGISHLQSGNKSEKIELSHNQNDIKFEYVGLHFADSEKNQYQYQLIPDDNGWINAGLERTARYDNLPPGKYTFQVKAANSDGVWNEEGSTINFTINSPWWQTWWAYLLFALTTIGSILGYIRYRSHALLKVNKLLEGKVADRTAELKESLDNLKSTQAQLIQSEKLASLGELTAGIAHEIQNPLNFVNNFSEVSSELIDEMNEEIENGDMEEVKVISADLKTNLTKILHHGKRADGIVKGMLQHSRTSTGQKEPTDINALADEYLRLAYHGLRAKVTLFNATLETDFDQTIGKVDIIAQDIGRVLLNIITNAFHAVHEKDQNSRVEYQPTVSIKTEKKNNEIIVSIKDNGGGIPESIKDKIFQPFFTTKPAGEGTGLGLSLANDIVKAHGGELKVESKEKETTIFKIHIPI